MFLTLALAVLPRPIDLGGIDLHRARHLSGRLVATESVVGKPPMTYGRVTDVGAADRDDGAERGALLRGRRFDVAVGRRVRVVGVLRVIDHEPAVVGGALVRVERGAG
jgi:hypothetical protein